MPSRRRFLAATGTVGLGALAGCIAAEPHYVGFDEAETRWWPQPGFDAAGTCYNPKAVGPRSEVRERWTLDVSGPSTRPVAADGLVYLPTATAVRAVDAATGEERWREDGGDPQMWPRSVVHFLGTVYVAWIGDPGVLALDAETGAREWAYAAGDAGAQSLLIDPRHPTLYVGCDDGSVRALDPDTGEVRWRRRLFGGVSSFARGIPELLVATEAGEVYALRPDDGRGLWRRRLPGSIRSLATANGEGAFVGLFAGSTFELDAARNGATEWRTGAWGADSLVVSGNTVFAAGDRLVAIDASSGRRRWVGGETTRCGPAAAGDTVYAASETHVSGYDFGGGFGVDRVRLGAKRWSYPVDGRPEQGIAVADGAVFVLTEGTAGTSTAYALEEA